MSEKKKTKYTAIKPHGFSYYIWFETEKTTQRFGMFFGNKGWGKGGAFTEIKCQESEIDSWIYSDELQYS